MIMILNQGRSHCVCVWGGGCRGVTPPLIRERMEETWWNGQTLLNFELNFPNFSNLYHYWQLRAPFANLLHPIHAARSIPCPTEPFFVTQLMMGGGGLVTSPL